MSNILTTHADAPNHLLKKYFEDSIFKGASIDDTLSELDDFYGLFLLESKNKRVDGKVTYYLHERLHGYEFPDKFLVNEIHSEVNIIFKDSKKESEAIDIIECRKSIKLSSLKDFENLNLDGHPHPFCCTSFDNFLNSYAFNVMLAFFARCYDLGIWEIGYNDIDVEIKIHELYADTWIDDID